MTTLYTTMDSPVGTLLLTATTTHLTGVMFPRMEPLTLDGQEAPETKPLRQAREQLEAYFQGTLRDFDLPLSPQGTPFQQRVWQALRDIPYGETTSYGAIARAIGKPTAVRAVGGANGKNPISIIIPCHRVVGSDGSLTGFGGGLPTKRLLLELEGG